MCVDHAARYCKSAGNNPERSRTPGMEKILAKMEKVWVEKILAILEKVIILIRQNFLGNWSRNFYCIAQFQLSIHWSDLKYKPSYATNVFLQSFGSAQLRFDLKIKGIKTFKVKICWTPSYSTNKWATQLVRWYRLGVSRASPYKTALSLSPSSPWLSPLIHWMISF